MQRVGWLSNAQASFDTRNLKPGFFEKAGLLPKGALHLSHFDDAPSRNQVFRKTGFLHLWAQNPQDSIIGPASTAPY
jgi:hypothetical protein